MGDFKQLQQDFINHIRDPENHPEVAGIEDRRLKIYRELFFNNVLGFVSSGFPVLCSLYDECRWQALVRRFFIEHDCKSPYFIDISKAFLNWLSQEREPQDDDYPFMLELAHYEWAELDVSVRQVFHEHAKIEPDEIGDAPLVLCETAWPLSYSFAVHQISADNKPTEGQPGGVHLIVYRDEDDDVQFMQINGVTAMLLQLIGDNPGATLSPLIEAMCEMLPHFAPEQIEAGANDVMAMLAERKIVRRLSS